MWMEADTHSARANLPPLEPPSLIHLNSAGCSLPSKTTLATVQSYLHREATRGGYETLDASHDELERPYTALAHLINCDPQEIAIVTSATAAWQQVVYGLAWTWQPGDRVLTSVAEYGSNMIALLQLVKRTGIRVEVIPETPDHDIDVDALQSMMSGGKPPVLVCVSHVPTSSGRVYDAAAVGAVCRRASVLFMLDACQSVGQLPVDVEAIGCDFLSATGRKYLRGPRGSGFLFCRREAMSKFEPAVLDNTGAAWSARDEYQLTGSARRFESYEMSFAAKVGLGVAVSECVQLGIERIWGRIQQLAAALRDGLSAVPGVEIQDRGRQLCGLVSFTVEGLSADAVQRALSARHINTSISRTASSRVDYELRGLSEVVRASVHYFNTREELRELVQAVAQLVQRGGPAGS